MAKVFGSKVNNKVGSSSLKMEVCDKFVRVEATMPQM